MNERETDLVVGEDGAAGLEEVAVDERHDVHVVLRAHRRRHDRCAQEEGRYKATWEREFKLPRRKAGPPNHLNDDTFAAHTRNIDGQRREVPFVGTWGEGAGG